jgi:hypothetical protein
MSVMWINRYMVALAIGLGSVAGMARLHGDLFVFLVPVAVCFLMVAGGVVDNWLHARNQDYLR